jgi:hypothetical protein
MEFSLLYYKGKAIPVQAWTSHEGSKMLRLPDEGGMIVSRTQRPPIPLDRYSWFSFLL